MGKRKKVKKLGGGGDDFSNEAVSFSHICLAEVNKPHLAWCSLEVILENNHTRQSSLTLKDISIQKQRISSLGIIHYLPHL